jgi:hypothetical protein
MQPRPGVDEAGIDRIVAEHPTKGRVATDVS